jgi:hypothetical protein
MKNILVQMADRRWTMAALHLACGLARQHVTSVTLLRLISVPHPGWLGVYEVLSSGQESRDLQEYRFTAEDYAVSVVIHSMQYVTLKEAVVQAADFLDADTVFAKFPRSFIPGWYNFQRHSMEQQLRARQRRLYMLDTDSPVMDWFS